MAVGFFDIIAYVCYNLHHLSIVRFSNSLNSLTSEVQGATILVDNKGCIKLVDFGASKKVVELVWSSKS